MKTNAGAELASLQARLQNLEELIHGINSPEEAAQHLDAVREGIHRINEAYINYATAVWEVRAEFKLDVV